MRIDVSGVLSSWLTAETKSCCWRASRIWPTPKRYMKRNPPHEHGRERDGNPGKQRGARARAADESTTNASSRSPNGGENRARCSTVPASSSDAEYDTRSPGRRASLERAALERDVEPLNAADAARAVRRVDGGRDERCAIDERALHIALAAAPYVAEQDEMAAVEHAELERIDLARESAHASTSALAASSASAAAAAAASARAGSATSACSTRFCRSSRLRSHSRARGSACSSRGLQLARRSLTAVRRRFVDATARAPRLRPAAAPASARRSNAACAAGRDDRRSPAPARRRRAATRSLSAGGAAGTAAAGSSRSPRTSWLRASSSRSCATRSARAACSAAVIP